MMGDDFAQVTADATYLMSCRDFLFEVLDQEIKVLEDWKVRPESYSRDFVSEFSDYDLNNEDLLTLSYGISMPAVVKENLALTSRTCEEKSKKLQGLSTMYQKGLDEYLELIVKNTPQQSQSRRFRKDRHVPTAVSSEEAAGRGKSGETQQQGGAAAAAAAADATTTSQNQSAAGIGKFSASSKWKALSRQDADDKLYGNKHHPPAHITGVKMHGSAAAMDEATAKAAEASKVGPKDYWTKLTGGVHAELLRGTTVEKIIEHHQKLMSLKKGTEFGDDKPGGAKAAATANAAPRSVANTAANTYTATPGKASAAAAASATDMDRTFIQGPALSITFKPSLWRQFSSNSKGQQKMDLLRKEALRQRHQSTYVVSSAGAGAGAGAGGGFSSAMQAFSAGGSPLDQQLQSTSAGASGRKSISASPAAGNAGDSSSSLLSARHDPNVVTFVDLIKSMSIFHHLSNEDISKLESKCSQIRFVDGELVLSEGDLSASAYIISGGIITVQRENPLTVGVKETVSMLTRGDFFGDTSYYGTVSARTCRSSFISIGDSVSAFSVPGDTFRKYAYKKNSEFKISDAPEVAGSLGGAGGASGKSKGKASASSIHIGQPSRREDITLQAHLDSYMEFLMLFHSEAAIALFEGAQDHIKPNTVRPALFGNTSVDDDSRDIPAAAGAAAGAGAVSGSGGFGPKAKARSSISMLLDKSMGGASRRMSASHSKQLAGSFSKLLSSPSETVNDGAMAAEPDKVDHFANIFGKSEGSDSDNEDGNGNGNGKEKDETRIARRAADTASAEQSLREQQANIVDSRRRLVLAMMGTASPELELADTLEALIKLVKEFFQVDRVGVFVIDKIKNSMTLYMSQFDRLAKLYATPAPAAAAAAGGGGGEDAAIENGGSGKAKADTTTDEDAESSMNKTAQLADSLYIKVPLKGIAGHIAKTGEIVVLPDCYEHPLFDSNMDQKTGYRTKQMLCVPCFDAAVDGNVVGVLQCINPFGVATSASAVLKGKDGKVQQQQLQRPGKGRDGGRDGGKGTSKNDTASRSSRSSAMVEDSDSSSSSSDEDEIDTTAKKKLDHAAMEEKIKKNGGNAEFTKTDQMLAVMISQLVGSVIASHKNRVGVEVTAASGVGVSTPASFIRKPLGVKLSKLVYNAPEDSKGVSPDADRARVLDMSNPLQFPDHVKCTATVFHGNNQMGDLQFTDKVPRDLSLVHGKSNGGGSGGEAADGTELDATPGPASGPAGMPPGSKGPLRKAKKTVPFEKTLSGPTVTWDIDQTIEFPDVWIRDLPQSARLILQFYGAKGHPLCWCAINLFGFEKELVASKRVVRLWDGVCAHPLQAASWPERSALNGNRETYHAKSFGIDKYIMLEFKSFDRPVVFAPSLVNRNKKEDITSRVVLSLGDRLEKLTDAEYLRFVVLSGISRGYTSEPLRNLSASDKAMVWGMRRSLLHHPSLVPIFLMSVPWDASECVYEAHQLLTEWRLPHADTTHHLHHTHGAGVNDNNSAHVMASRTIALIILYGSVFTDPKVRAYAVVQLLKRLTDRDLGAILLPLVGALKYERFGDNALVRYLMRRSVENPHQIGTPLYQLLRSQIDKLSRGPEGYENPSAIQRYETLCQLYLRKSGDRVRASLGHCELVHRRIANICRRILDESMTHTEEVSEYARSNFGFGSGAGIGTGDKSAASGSDNTDKREIKRRALVTALRALELPSSFDFPGNAKYRVNELILEDCAYQKTWPYRSIKLAFRVDEGAATQKRLKRGLNKCVLWARVGMDPSAEKVALSMLKAIDSLWHTYGLDLHVVTYNCIHQFFRNNDVENPLIDGETFESSLFEVPMHACSFQDILSKYAKYNDLTIKTKSSGLASLFGSGVTNGMSNIKQLGGIVTSGPKEYVTLSNREFPNDLVENWMCMQNFESAITRLNSVEGNLRVLDPSIHSTVFEKYFDDKKRVRRGAVWGERSMATKIDAPRGQKAVELFEPNPAAYEWRLRFARSLAGWYVSSYVLHIINRTAENIMFLPSGEVFNFELNCLNLEERLQAMKTALAAKESAATPATEAAGAYSPRPPAGGHVTNAAAEHTPRHESPITSKQGYATCAELHTDASALFMRAKEHDKETEKILKKRNLKVRAAVAGGARKIGINTGNFTNEGSGGSGYERTHVPLLPCFLRILGPANGSVFAYFREFALNAFSVLRAHPEFLMQTLKSSLLTIPLFGASEESEAAMAPVVESLMANLMLEMEFDDTAARGRFLSHLKADMAFYEGTAAGDSYPAQGAFVDK